MPGWAGKECARTQRAQAHNHALAAIDRQPRRAAGSLCSRQEARFPAHATSAGRRKSCRVEAGRPARREREGESEASTYSPRAPLHFTRRRSTDSSSLRNKLQDCAAEAIRYAERTALEERNCSRKCAQRSPTQPAAAPASPIVFSSRCRNSSRLRASQRAEDCDEASFQTDNKCRRLRHKAQSPYQRKHAHLQQQTLLCASQMLALSLLPPLFFLRAATTACISEQANAQTTAAKRALRPTTNAEDRDTRRDRRTSASTPTCNSKRSFALHRCSH